jgi:high-affinity nickel-transport protein
MGMTTTPSPGSDGPAEGSRHPRRTYAWMYGVVVALHVAGWGTLVAFVLPAHLDLGGTGAFGIGLGLTAYTLGLRHAFDADHIAAIDNTTRKLHEEEHVARPVSVGFWFSLGHSTVVVVMVALIAFGLRALAGEIAYGNSWVEHYGDLAGALVSGVFLMVIGVMNLAVLIGIVGVFRRMRHGEYDERTLETQLANRGLMNRFFGRLMRLVTRPWHIYPIGILFGFGFDTVTEIALLVIAGAAVAGAVPWYAVLVLPILFTAGMTLMDTTDGVFMTSAYGWAFSRPVRKVFYNITVTAISVVVAVVIGLIELAHVVAGSAGIEHGPLAAVAGFDPSWLGYGLVGTLVATWLAALAIWRFGRVEQRWAARLAATE